MSKPKVQLAESNDEWTAMYVNNELLEDGNSQELHQWLVALDRKGIINYAAPLQMSLDEHGDVLLPRRLNDDGTYNE